MPPVALLLLLPRVALLPPEAPEPLAATAQTCASAFASSPVLETVRLEAAPGALGDVAARVDPDLSGAAQSYRELRFREAAAALIRVTESLETEATTASEFELLFTARIKLGMALLAQRRAGPAQEAFRAAARLAPDDRLSEGDYSPAVVAAYEDARTVVTAEPRVPFSLDVRAGIAGVVPTTLIDGRPVSGAQVALGAGRHVVYATAPGHTPARQVVTLPRAEPLALVLAPAAGELTGRPLVVVGLSVAPTPRGVRLTLKQAGQPEISEEAAPGSESDAARRLASALASRLAPPPLVRTEPDRASAAAGTGYDWRTSLDRPQRRSSSGSVFGRWWFWTIVGGVTVVAVVGVAAAGKADPGTDIRVGVAE